MSPPKPPRHPIRVGRPGKRKATDPPRARHKPAPAPAPPPPAPKPKPLEDGEMPTARWALQLAAQLQRQTGATQFVEGGTFMGWTARQAANLFRDVWTMELDPALHQASRQRYAQQANIRWLLGDSPRLLGEMILPQLQAPAIFWLDAHCCSPETLPAGAWECPLLEELDLILRHDPQHCLLIDDARLFLAPPGRPHRRTHWPDLKELFTLFQTRSQEQGFPLPYLAVMQDVLVVVPPELEEELKDFWQTHLETQK